MVDALSPSNLAVCSSTHSLLFDTVIPLLSSSHMACSCLLKNEMGQLMHFQPSGWGARYLAHHRCPRSPFSRSGHTSLLLRDVPCFTPALLPNAVVDFQGSQNSTHHVQLAPPICELFRFIFDPSLVETGRFIVSVFASYVAFFPSSWVIYFRCIDIEHLLILTTDVFFPQASLLCTRRKSAVRSSTPILSRRSH